LPFRMHRKSHQKPPIFLNSCLHEPSVTGNTRSQLQCRTAWHMLTRMIVIVSIYSMPDLHCGTGNHRRRCCSHECTVSSASFRFKVPFKSGQLPNLYRCPDCETRRHLENLHQCFHRGWRTASGNNIDKRTRLLFVGFWLNYFTM
jgi:hypothetical protein